MSDSEYTLVLEATSDISVRLEMRQIGPNHIFVLQPDGPMNLADTDIGKIMQISSAK